MQETKTQEVVIEDVSYDTMMILVKYMYGVLKEMPNDHEAVINLFKV